MSDVQIFFRSEKNLYMSGVAYGSPRRSERFFCGLGQPEIRINDSGEAGCSFIMRPTETDGFFDEGCGLGYINAVSVIRFLFRCEYGAEFKRQRRENAVLVRQIGLWIKRRFKSAGRIAQVVKFFRQVIFLRPVADNLILENG